LSPNTFEYSVYNAGFDASWEIDIFGGKRRALEATTAEWEGAIESRNDVMVSLLAEVSRNYVELRGSQCRLEIAQRNFKLQEEALELTRDRFQCGVVSELDVTQSAALLAGMQAAIPPLDTAVRTAMYSIAVLLGLEPGKLVTELSPPMPLPTAPPEAHGSKRSWRTPVMPIYGKTNGHPVLAAIGGILRMGMWAGNKVFAEIEYKCPYCNHSHTEADFLWACFEKTDSKIESFG